MYLNIKAYFSNASAKAFMKVIMIVKGAQLKDIR